MEKIISLYNLSCSVKPQKSDAIVWLQGDRYDRGKKVVDLYKNGWSKNIILTGNNQLLSSKLRPGESNVSLEKMNDWLKKRGVDGKDIIIDDQSLNTNDQAKNTIALAKKNIWSSILLVGSSYHQPRAFLTFLYYSKKNKWLGTIVNQPFFVGKDAMPGGRKEISEKLFKKEIHKIEIYKKNLSTVTAGIRYIEDKFIRINLKPVKLNDAKFLLELRNDQTTRENSLQQEKIDFIDHVNWLKKVLVDKKRSLFTIYNKKDKNKIGQMRFDIAGKQAKISIALKPEYRGKGYGEEVVRYGMNYFAVKHDNVNKIIAEIKQNNKASLFTFKKCGYIARYKKNGIINLDYTI